MEERKRSARRRGCSGRSGNNEYGLRQKPEKSGAEKRHARKNVYLRRLLELVVLLLAGTALFALALVCPAVKTVFDAIRPWKDIVFFSLFFLIAACEGIESFRQRRFWRGTGWSVAAIMAAGVLAGECVKIWRG